MNLKSRSLLMGFSSLVLAGLLLLGVNLALTQASIYKMTRVTTASDGDRDSVESSVSADGTKIAFASESDFFNQNIPVGQIEIWLYDTTTMTLTRVTTASHSDRFSRSPSVSADGTKIAFYSDSDFFSQGIPDEQFEIWLYDTTTMTLTRVTTASHTGRGSVAPSVSADGTKIAFFGNSDFLNQGIPDNQVEIWLYDMTTMTLTRVTTASHSDRFSRSPSVSPDGTKIAFYSDSDFFSQGILDEQFEIWLYDTATMTLTRVTTASHIGRADSRFPSVSADGTKIAFHSDSDFLNQGISQFQNEIWLYDTMTMTLTRVTTASDSIRGSVEPSVSADGTKIAFASDSDFFNQGIPLGQDEIWLYDTTTMTLTRVTTASDSIRDSKDPSVSADGTKIAFYSDSDFFSQGVPHLQNEIWLFEAYEETKKIYLPLIVK